MIDVILGFDPECDLDLYRLHFFIPTSGWERSFRSFDRLPVEFLNDIAFLQSGGGGGRTRVNRDYHRAL